jgi:RimJ/RimL family protein N-acetyltransferase
MQLTRRDPAVLTVRPLREPDRAAYLRAVAGLSDRTRLLRFGTPKPTLTQREVDHLLDVGHDGAEAYVAIDPAGEIVAIARIAPMTGTPEAGDVAIVVADAWQGAGVGGLLLERLIPVAWAAGYARLHAQTLADNRPIHTLLARHGFRRGLPSWGVVEWELGR